MKRGKKRTSRGGGTARIGLQRSSRRKPPRLVPLADRIARLRRNGISKSAIARVTDWLARDVRAQDRARLRSIFRRAPHARTLVELLADHSPYLWDLCRADPARLAQLLACDPDRHIRALLSGLARKMARTRDEAAAMRFLRQAKAEAALMIAIADIGGVWPVMAATRALTELADASVTAAVRFLLAEAAQAGKFRPPQAVRVDDGSGYFVVAMGKMGAHELNYSSDIDIMAFYDPQIAPLAQDIEPGPFFVRLTQRLVRLLNERSAEGYVFRTDLRLRPDPASTPIAISVPAALSYYESAGRNWERAALIKARVCAGDRKAGQALLDALAPFVWRKYLDYAAVADIRAMKQQIHAYRGHGDIAVEGHNIKIGRGGIREIEFFVQTQQLIAGGRHPELRASDTLTALSHLADGGWIDTATRDAMSEAYLFLRMVEHRLQMLNDEQTQTLPESSAGMERFAQFMDYRDREAFAGELVRHLQRVQSQYARLFEPAGVRSVQQLNFPPDHDDRKTLDRLNELGFKSALEASAKVRHWLTGEYPALRTEFAREQIGALAPVLIEQAAQAQSPDAVLALFDRFLGNLRRGSRLLPLLRQNPPLVALMAMVLASAPRLADMLARQPDVIDALLEPDFFGALPDDAAIRVLLRQSVSDAGLEQDLLERVRMFGLEQMFLVGVRVLSGTISAAQAGEALARLADAVIDTVRENIARSFAATYGVIAGGAFAIVAMGKLGGSEMTATSDLDLIVIYDCDEAHPESDGQRRLYGGQYFARLTQRLVSALTAQTNSGALYKVDMRLRPSGRSGPVATSVESFAGYQRDEAWTWEHMALTRARVVAASPGFAARVDDVLRSVLCSPRDSVAVAADVVAMRGAIAAERGDRDPWDLKHAAGGLVDIEFIAQYLQLVHAARQPDILDTNTIRSLEKARRLGLLTAEQGEALVPAARLYQNLTQVLRLCLDERFDPVKAPDSLRGLLARAADVPDFETLEATLNDTQLAVRACFVAILGREPVTRRLAPREDQAATDGN